jgi:hypothetical protein
LRVLPRDEGLFYSDRTLENDYNLVAAIVTITQGNEMFIGLQHALRLAFTTWLLTG